MAATMVRHTTAAAASQRVGSPDAVEIVLVLVTVVVRVVVEVLCAL